MLRIGDDGSSPSHRNRWDGLPGAAGFAAKKLIHVADKLVFAVGEEISQALVFPQLAFPQGHNGTARVWQFNSRGALPQGSPFREDESQCRAHLAYICSMFSNSSWGRVKGDTKDIVRSGSIGGHKISIVSFENCLCMCMCGTGNHIPTSDS